MPTPNEQSDHEARIRYLEKVTESLDKHLGKLVERADRFEKRIFIAAVILFASSGNASDLVKLIAP